MDYPLKTRVLIVTIIRNLSIDQYRRNQRSSEHEVLLESYTELWEEWVEDLAVSTDTAMGLRRALDAIGLTYADPLMLRYHYGYAPPEIARLLNLKEGTVRWRLHQGKKLLAKELRKEEEHGREKAAGKII